MKWFSLAILFTISLGAYQTQTTGNKDKHSNKTTESKGSESQEGQSAQPSVIQQQTIYSAPSEQEGQAQKSNSAKPSNDWIDKVNAFSTLVIALFTILLFLAVIGQTRTSRAIERAWVFVDTGEITDDFVPNPNAVEFLDIRPVIRNYGRTVARITRVSIRPQQVPSAADLSPNPAYENIRDVDIILPPDTPIQPLRVRIALSDFIEIRHGTPVLYIYGFVDYLAFGKTKQSRFCLIYYVPHGFDATQRGFYLAMHVPEAYTRCT